MQNLEWKDKIDKESDIEAKDVNSLANAIITIIDWINQGGGDVDLSGYVTEEYLNAVIEVANTKINTKQPKKNVSIFNDSEAIPEPEIDIADNGESYYEYPLNNLKIVNTGVNGFGYQSYANFMTGDNPTSPVILTDGVTITWIGDDCDVDGIFTPLADTYYEICFKCTIDGWVARVGAC